MTTKHPAFSAMPQPIPLLSGVLAGMIGCGVPLVQGVTSGWPLERTLAYGGVALIYMLLITFPGVPNRVIQAFYCTPWAFLLVGGLLCFALQAISGDPYVQPIAFSVPFVHGALLYNGRMRPVLASGAFYLGLVALGQAVFGWRTPATLLVPVISYTAVFGFLYAFVGISITQAAARQRADVLAADLARERDYLARLVGIGALLTRELDLPLVMQQIADAGHVLALASRVRVWLHTPDGRMLQQAATSPGEQFTPDAALEAVLRATEPHNDGELLVLPLLFEGENLGAIELRERTAGLFTTQDVERLHPFANTAAVAIRNAQLYQQAMLTATLAERNRLARELHDTIAQGLTAVTMQIDAAQRGLDRDPERVRARLQRASDLSRATLDDVRRSVWTLASPLIDGAALHAALTEQCAQFGERTGIDTRYASSGPPPQLGPAAASQLLRIVQEALHNVEKHAQAEQVIVSTACCEGKLQVTIDDDGIGFDPGSPASGAGGYGLISLRERANLIGSELAITSAPGQGTRIAVTLHTEAV